MARFWDGLRRAIQTDPAGVSRVLEVADSIPRHPERDTVSPSLRVELAAIIENESGWNPAIRNGINCVGLIQFCPSTAHALGTNPDALARMSLSEQSEYVYRYYLKTPKPRIPGDLYLATFLPSFVGAPPGTVIAREGVKEYVRGTRLTEDIVWRQNPGLRSPGGGPITVDSVRAVVLRAPPSDIDIDSYSYKSKPPSGDDRTGAGWVVALAVVIYLLARVK